MNFPKPHMDYGDSKTYFFTYYDRTENKEVQFDDYIVSQNETEAREFIANYMRMRIEDFNEKDIVCIGTDYYTYDKRKKYYFSWYNHLAQTQQINFIKAKDITEAKQIAILIMQVYGGSYNYDNTDIYCIYELDEDQYYTMNEMKEIYDNRGKEFVLPEIKEDED